MRDLPIKIGVLTPTYNRPDLARFLTLQMANQQTVPDVLCIHQNGTQQSYEWAISDIKRQFPVRWIHTPEKLPQDEWYAVPLEHLIAEECTRFFWCDHDDIYGASHIKNGVALINEGRFDFSVNRRSGVLLLKTPYEIQVDELFAAHDTGGMSSSMCFNRAFAIELLKDLRTNGGKLGYSDQVVNRVTKPKFRCLLADDPPTTTYVCHQGTYSSSSWLK